MCLFDIIKMSLTGVSVVDLRMRIVLSVNYKEKFITKKRCFNLYKIDKTFLRFIWLATKGETN